MDSKTAQGPPAYAHPTPMNGTQMSAIPAIGEGHNYATAVPLNQLQDQPVPVDCPICHQRALTNVEFKSGNTTNAWALGLCIFTCCCCIPFCITSTKDAEHKCSNCHTSLATWHRSGRIEVVPH